MEISRDLFIGLGISIGVALALMIGAFVWVTIKRKKIVAEAQKQKAFPKGVEPRKNAGELLWELKNKTENPLDDAQMEFLLNTIWINKYKTFNLIGFDEKYEEESFKKIVQAKKSVVNPDLTIINGDLEYNKIFDAEYKKAKAKKMFVITNSNRKDKKTKNTINYLKLIKAKYEWQNYGKGIILVVK